MNIHETYRLILREQTEEDADFILELVNSEGWLQYVGDRGIRTAEAARQHIRNGVMKKYKEDGYGSYIVELKDGDIPIGICGLFKRKGLEHADIGFALLPAYYNKGYAFEAASVVMDSAPALGLTAVMGITVKENDASIRLLNKLGLTFKELIRLPDDPEELMLFEKPLAGMNNVDK